MADLWPTVLDLMHGRSVSCIIDVGAHHGSMTAWFRSSFPTAHIYAVEPDPVTFERLQEAYAHDSSVTLANVGLLSSEGRATFHRGHMDATSSMFPRNTTGRRYFHSAYTMRETLEVVCRTLDSYCADARIKQIDILKLDTQGSELAILEGGSGLLSAGRIEVVVTEFFCIPHYEGAPLLDEIWTFLRRHGYELFDLAFGMHGRDGQARYGDAIFLSPTFRAARNRCLPAEP